MSWLVDSQQCSDFTRFAKIQYGVCFPDQIEILPNPAPFRLQIRKEPQEIQMSNDLDNLIQQLREQGPRQFAAWNSEAFEAFLAGPLANLERMLKWKDKNSTDSQVVPNYLRMVYEGIGAGWVSLPDDNLPATTFLGHCLQTLIPHAIAQVPKTQRSRVMQHVWNLGEGLAKEPKWLNQFAITQTDWSTGIEKLDQHLAKILAPVLSPMPPSNWSGKLHLVVVNFRERFESFVPGQMYLACPALLCIADRIDPLLNIAILLRKNGQSDVLGTVGRLPEYTESFGAPKIETHSDDVIINGKKIETPLICSPRQTLCIAGGFVAVSAQDSQRLWLVDAA